MVLQAGFAKADITPRGRCDMNGFVARQQPSVGVAAPLSGRILMVSEGRVRGVVAICDLLGLTLNDSARVEAAIAQAAGVPVRNVFLACTHSHSGPMSMPLGTVGRFDPRYIDFLSRRLAHAAAAARQDLAPVTALRIGAGAVPKMGRFRCAVHEPGRQQWPGTFSVSSFLRREAKPIVLVHYGVHPYTLGERNRRLHPDYPGPLCEILERGTDGHAMFLPGCGADVEAVPAWGTSDAEVRRYARGVAEAAQAALRSALLVPGTPLRMSAASPRVRFGFIPKELRQKKETEKAVAALAAGGVRVPRNAEEWQESFKAGRLPKTARFRMHVLRIGSLVLVGLPAELFWDTGKDLAGAFSDATVLAVSQAGGNVGYLPRKFAYRHKTYEAARAYEWYGTAGALAPETEPAIRAVAVAMALKLIARPSSRLRPPRR